MQCSGCNTLESQGMCRFVPTDSAQMLTAMKNTLKHILRGDQE